MKTALSIIAFGLVTAGLIFMLSRDSASPEVASVDNVSVVDGKQVIEIKVRGGYSPRLTQAQSGLPTTIRFITNGTFDCSLALKIRSLKISQILPQTGSTDIEIGTPEAGAFLGTCSMGMYRFQINFKE